MKYSWRYKLKRAIAGGLAVLMLCPGPGDGSTAWGAEAAVDVDEAMYVNLDFYGSPTKVNVVKSCSFNGRTQFTDYGNYEDVINMTNDAVPVLEEGLVRWTMPQPHTGRFYYQCTLNADQVALPWNFDVSYKLNGVPADADKLAGASGLVEINIKALPNEKAKPYYRDNMILMAAVPVDLSKSYSVEAQGSQTQNLGETTAVVFSALPGEEGDFTVHIGTDRFESTGVVLSMVPGTMEDLKHIKDFKEAKDTWKDAGDQFYDSLEQMALSVEGMRQGVGQVQAGMDYAERARQKWSSSKEGILAGNDQALAALAAMSGQMDAMVPHLQTAKDSAEVVHKSMNDIVDTLGEMQDPLQKLSDRLRDIEGSSERISDNLPEIQAAMEQLLVLDFQLQQSEDLFLINLKSVRNSGLRANGLYYEEEPDEEALDELEEEYYWSGVYLGAQGAGENDEGNEPDKEAGDGAVEDEGSAIGQAAAGGAVEDAGSPTGQAAAGGAVEDAGSATGQPSAGSPAEGMGSATGQVATGSPAEGMGSATGQAAAGSPAEDTVSATGQPSAGSPVEDTVSATGQPSGDTPGENVASLSAQDTAASSAEAAGNIQASTSDGRSRAGKSGSTDAFRAMGKASSSIEKRSVLVLGAASAQDIISGLAGKGKALTTIAGQSKELTDAFSDLMEDTSDAARYSSELVDNLDFLIEDITALNDSLNVYYPDLQASLDDTRELVTCTTDALNSTISTLTIVQNTLKDTSGDFDAAARDSLRGSMELLDKSLNILDSTASLRHAGRTMKNTMDSEMDKFDSENRFLYMDPSAQKVSFTSDKNRAPKTLQIVLRTDEITLEDETAKTADAETAKAKVSPLRRMWNVLVEMWRAIVSIFKNR